MLRESVINYWRNGIFPKVIWILEFHNRTTNCMRILFETPLEDVAKDLIKSVGYSVTAMKFRNSEIEA